MGKEKKTTEEKKPTAREQRIREIVRQTVAFTFGLTDTESFDDGSLFIDDLSGDSLDCVEFVMAIEEIFNIAIPEEEAEKLLSTKNVVDFLCEKDAKSKLDIDESAIPHK